MDIATLRASLPPPHPAARPFLLAAAALIVIGWLAAPLHFLLWLGLVFGLFTLFFFRDPERVPPDWPGAVVAPADGRVVAVGTRLPPPELGLPPEPRPYVGIFLSVLDVHINRAPVGGQVRRVVYRPGAFIDASLDKASETNERNALLIVTPGGEEVAVVQIAGLIARRIVCWAREGSFLRTGERFGLIRFGSRTDLYLPPGTAIRVREGQRMVGGESVIAELAP
jgi:phosphatidylserine decarboxylase